MAERVSHHRRADPAASQHDLSVYDDRELLGHVCEEGGCCHARTADGRNLGVFRNRKAAFDAIDEAAQQARGRAG